MLAAVRQIVARHDLFRPRDAVVVGVSGGSDSLCLLHVLVALGSELDITLHVAHLNHRLRGAESDADAAFVQRLAESWGLACSIDEVDVSALAAVSKLGEEEAARHARYTFLARTAYRVGAAAVAVGHNADDQTETVLMHLLRGTGLAGLRGMAPCSVMGDPPLVLIRPLLEVPRVSIEAYCREHDLQPRLDRSNLDRTFFRNRLRHEVLPALEEVAPGVNHRLRQMAQLVAADYELVQTMMDQVWPGLVVEVGDEALALDLQAWRNLPLGLRRGALLRAAFQLRPDLSDFGFSQVETARQVADTATTGAQVSLPGRLSLTVNYECLWISTAGHPPAQPADWPALPTGTVIPLRIPGCTQVPGGWLLEATFFPADNGIRNFAWQNENPWRAFLDFEQAGNNLVLRTRAPGDRFQPLGMEGHSASLSDFMINRRIPAAWRDQVPILSRVPDTGQQAGEILWIAGWRLDERVRVRLESRRVLRLDFRRPSDPT